MKRRQLLAVGGTGLTLTIAGCSTESSEREEGSTDSGGEESTSSDSGNSGEESANSGGSEQVVEILDHEPYNEGQYDAGVKGTLENVSGEELSYVAVNAYFLDSEGTQIGEGVDNTSDLAAGRRWEFDVMYLGDEAERLDTYEIETEVTNF